MNPHLLFAAAVGASAMMVSLAHADAAKSPGSAPKSLPEPIEYLPGTRLIDLCLRSTGTNLKLPEGQCVSANGYSISRDALMIGGAVNLGQALRGL